MKKLLKILLIVIVIAGVIHLLNGGTISLKDIKNHGKDLVQSNNENVLGVKNGSPLNYPGITYGEAFESFFSSPTWTYFEGTREGSDTVYDIVEFTGNCTYMNEKVKALIQFELNNDDGTFYASYLSINDVPQSQIMLYGLIDKAFSEYKDAHT